MTWDPLLARLGFSRPEVGWLIGENHGVWRVVSVQDDGLTASERERWLANGMPERVQSPYVVAVEHIDGHLPVEFGGETRGEVRVGYGQPADWHRYEGGRWPKCSCCGEPMPCRAELTDGLVEKAAKKVDVMSSRMPGCCWGCGEPITARQQKVSYRGENVDLPGGMPVVFHVRRDCAWLAQQYEARWLAADPSRRRILTYPKCGGLLITHKDGSQDCKGDRRDPECLGAVSHDHGNHAACYAAGPECPLCPRPTRREDLWGCGSVRRPKFRDPNLPQGRPTPDVAKPDSRPLCHGVLFTHEDGTEGCKGGRDDCWDSSTYRHDRERSCRSLSHGCPQCESPAS